MHRHRRHRHRHRSRRAARGRRPGGASGESRAWSDCSQLLISLRNELTTLRSVVESANLSLAEHVCLTLIDQDVTHGWALGTLLASDGDVGRIWTLSRPLTYRA